MQYLQDRHVYEFSYQNIKLEYNRFCLMSDEEFILNLTKAIHLACFISYLKELPNECTISDLGIIHELVHLLDIPNENLVVLKRIRKQFEDLLKLS